MRSADQMSSENMRLTLTITIYLSENMWRHNAQRTGQGLPGMNPNSSEVTLPLFIEKKSSQYS